MGAAPDDRLEGKRVGAAAEELRFQLDLQLAFGPPLADHLLNREEAGARRLLGLAHPRQLDFVFRAPRVRQGIAQLLIEGGVRRDAADRSAEATNAAVLAFFEPGGQLGNGASAVGNAFPQVVRSRPEQLFAGDRGQEIDPPLGGSKASTPPGRSRSVK